MTTPQQAEQHRVTQAAIAARFAAELRRLWPSLNPRDMLNTAAPVARSAALLTREYSQASITSSALRYEQMRSTAGVRSSYRTPIVKPEPVADVEEIFKALTVNLWQPEQTKQEFLDVMLEEAQQAVGTALSDRVADAGRDELTTAGARDQAAKGFVRVAKPGACAFCTMLSTRSALYKTRETAGQIDGTLDYGTDARGSINRFHEMCRCQVVPVFGAYEPPAHTREAIALWEGVTADYSGHDKAKAFRRAWEQRESGSRREVTSPEKPAASQVSAFDRLSLDQIEHQIGVVEGLKDSKWKSEFLPRLQKRATELRAT